MNTFKTLLLNNFSSVKSIGENCEEDNIICLSNLNNILCNKPQNEIISMDFAVAFSANIPILKICTNKLYINNMTVVNSFQH